MSVLTNVRHERFAQAIAAGRSQVDSYDEAGYTSKSRDQNASKLAKHPKIRARISELLAEKAKIVERATEKAVESAAVCKADILRELWDNAMKAKDAVPVRNAKGEEIGEYTANWSASNRALELLGKELGMFIDRKEIRTGMLDDLTHDQRKEILGLLDEWFGVPGAAEQAFGDAGTAAAPTTH